MRELEVFRKVQFPPVWSNNYFEELKIEIKKVVDAFPEYSHDKLMRMIMVNSRGCLNPAQISIILGDLMVVEKTFVVTNVDDFECGVFGGEDMLKFYPTITTTGIRCRRINELWYIINPDTNKAYSDCSFFSEDELQYLQEV